MDYAIKYNFIDNFNVIFDFLKENLCFSLLFVIFVLKLNIFFKKTCVFPAFLLILPPIRYSLMENVLSPCCPRWANRLKFKHETTF